MRYVPVFLLLVLAACGWLVPPESDAEHDPAVSVGVPAVIEGLDGRAFLEIMEEGFGPGLVCGEPLPFTPELQQWSCTVTREYAWEVVVIGESLSAVHSVNASVGHANGVSRVDSGRAAGFLGWIAESAATVTGADSAAARQWVIANEHSDSAEHELAGLTYKLGGAEVRTLEIAATD
jgi:hypothetical protein